jgi:hypothetical protein
VSIYNSPFSGKFPWENELDTAKNKSKIDMEIFFMIIY